jgi:hypothetical protein
VKGRALVVDASSDTITAVDLATGTRSELASLPAIPSFSRGDLAFDGSNRLFLVERSRGSVLAIDATTGTSSVITSAALGAGPVLSVVRGVAFDAGRVVVAADAALIGVDPVTGNRTTLSSATMGAGPLLRAPESIAVGKLENAFVTDRIGRTSVLYAVDLVTGHRVVVSAR